MSLRIVCLDALNQRKAIEGVFPHGEIYDDDVGSMSTNKLVAGDSIASFENARDTRVRQKAATSLPYDRVVIYNEDACHVFRSKPAAPISECCSGLSLRSIASRLSATLSHPIANNSNARLSAGFVSIAARRLQSLANCLYLATRCMVVTHAQPQTTQLKRLSDTSDDRQGPLSRCEPMFTIVLGGNAGLPKLPTTIA
jgi:hypothetical protein